jgi:hypothetical protein
VTHRRLVSGYGQKVYSRKEVSMWCTKFKDGRKVRDTEKHRGRPRSSHIEENCVIVKSLAREDQ